MNYSNWRDQSWSNTNVKTSTAPEILADAARIMNQRGKDYDKPDGERSMARTVMAFNAITGHQMSEADGWLFMALLKQVRLFTSRTKTHEDSVKDLVAYCALLGESAMNGGLSDDL
jgi:hypothetical protein